METEEYYALDDGRAWSVSQARFVEADDPAYLAWKAGGNVPKRAPDPQGRATEAGLRETLEFYGRALGGLATLEQRAAMVRSERDRRIAACQWIVDRHADQCAAGHTPDLAPDAYQRWLVYRQALRDLPAQEGFPWEGGHSRDALCPWPVAPETVRNV